MRGFISYFIFCRKKVVDLVSNWIYKCLSLLIAFLCDNPRYFKLKAYQKILIGGLVITLGELISGVILNLWLHLNIWSYASDRFNFLGQIELKNCILWTLIITPLILWLDSHLTYYLYKEDKPISLIGFYKDLFTLK
ncbi:putative ABC transporter permease [Clostridium akagii]|uniref:putative ABC transporter permease n=1 Tax=Clostridium akagii TaxID=91623 RepID=UPI000A079FD6